MTISYTIPVAGSTLNSIADAQVATALQTLLTWANGNVDQTNLAAALAQAAGVNQSGQTVKGAVNIAASQSTASASYTTLTTPDQVTGIVLPTNGLIAVWYQATWQGGTPKAAIFIGANQLKKAGLNGGAPAVQEASGVAGDLMPLFTTPAGLYGSPLSAGSSYSGDVTTGQLIGADISNSATGDRSGGPCYVFAAAGTYTVSVQFKSSAGSVTASNRKLWVQALSFA